MAQIHELQYKVNYLNHAKEFYDPETLSSSGLSLVPSQPMSIPSPRGMIRAATLASSLIHRIHWVRQDTFLKVCLHRQHSSDIHRIWHGLLAD